MGRCVLVVLPTNSPTHNTYIYRIIATKIGLMICCADISLYVIFIQMKTLFKIYQFKIMLCNEKNKNKLFVFIYNFVTKTVFLIL